MKLLLSDNLNKTSWFQYFLSHSSTGQRGKHVSLKVQREGIMQNHAIEWQDGEKGLEKEAGKEPTLGLWEGPQEWKSACAFVIPKQLGHMHLSPGNWWGRAGGSGEYQPESECNSPSIPAPNPMSKQVREEAVPPLLPTVGSEALANKHISRDLCGPSHWEIFSNLDCIEPPWPSTILGKWEKRPNNKWY